MTKRVLLAEDEPNIATSLQFLLDRAGFSVQVQANGIAALASVLADPPDILVLDVMLPDLDGLQILREIRADKTAGDLPILMLTAKGAKETQDDALKSGADAFITKPFANTEVLAVVERLAGGGR